MPIYHYFSIYFMLIIASCVAVCGFYLSSRGEEIEHEDGTTTRTGKILKGWYFFWMQKSGRRKRYVFNTDHLAHLIRKMQPYGYSTNWYLVGIERDGKRYAALQTDAAGYASKMAIQQDFEVDLVVESNVPSFEPGGIVCIMRVERYEDVYRFPEWIRMMMAQCITCHASFWGSVVFWGFHYFCSNDLLHHYFYAIADANKYWQLVFCTWVLYTCSFAFVATFIYKKL